MRGGGVSGRKESVKSSRATKSLGALALAAALLAFPSLAVGNAQTGIANLTDLRVGVHPDHTRIVIETDGAAPYVLDPTEHVVLVHVDAAATAEAVTAKSPHLAWVKVEPTELGADVRIELKRPVEVKALVLTRPDRIVLDLYPKGGKAAAEAEPPALPTPEVLPEEEAPPVVAEAPPAPPEPALEPPSEEEPGLPEEENEPPLKLELPQGEMEQPEQAAQLPSEPAEEEMAGEPAAPSEVIEGRVVEPMQAGEQPSTPSAPTTPAAPVPPGSRFGSPFALGATAVVLLVLFVWLRRRLRAAEPRRMPPLPEEEPAPFEPPARAVAVSEETPTGESVFDVEPESLKGPPPEPVASLRTPAGTGLDAEDEAERRIAHLEKRIEELAESKDRLERQVAAQTEELRVQRAAIARTQRVLRSIAPKGEDESSSEPLARG